MKGKVRRFYFGPFIGLLFGLLPLGTSANCSLKTHELQSKKQECLEALKGIDQEFPLKKNLAEIQKRLKKIEILFISDYHLDPTNDWLLDHSGPESAPRPMFMDQMGQLGFDRIYFEMSVEEKPFPFKKIRKLKKNLEGSIKAMNLEIFDQESIFHKGMEFLSMIINAQGQDEVYWKKLYSKFSRVLWKNEIDMKDSPKKIVEDFLSHFVLSDIKKFLGQPAHLPLSSGDLFNDLINPYDWSIKNNLSPEYGQPKYSAIFFNDKRDGTMLRRIKEEIMKLLQDDSRDLWRIGVFVGAGHTSKLIDGLDNFSSHLNIKSITPSECSKVNQEKFTNDFLREISKGFP